jgi:hypothetical protein
MSTYASVAGLQPDQARGGLREHRKHRTRGRGDGEPERSRCRPGEDATEVIPKRIDIQHG